MPLDDSQKPQKDNKPLGRTLRDLINPALDDDRRMDQQKKILNEAFGRVLGMNLDKILADEFNHFAAQVDKVEKRSPQAKNLMIIDALTNVANDPEGNSKYSPVKRIQLPISTAFTLFQPEDIKELPNYIKLHEMARDLDIAIKITGLTSDELKSPNGAMPAILAIDLMKSYNEGAMENASLYPDLPPKAVKFSVDPSHRDFKL